MAFPRRITRVENAKKRMYGYLASAMIEQRHIRRFFSDLKYGSAEAALEAAEAIIGETIEEHMLYLVLRRRYRRRANTPGDVPGVNRIPSKPTDKKDMWLARWKDTNGTRRYRSFRISKYGEVEAYELALAARLEATIADREQLRALSAIVPEHEYRS